MTKSTPNVSGELPSGVGEAAREIAAATLAAWAADPGMIRRDARAEDELAQVAYAGRVVVELLQNAADASDAGGEVLIEWCAPTLRVSNSGSPVGAAGLRAMSGLRGSTKGAGAVGRFGVGFAAVAGVANRCVVASDVCAEFSRERTREVIGGAAPDAMSRVPMLRVPHPCSREPEPGFVTTIELDVRDDRVAQVDAAVAQLDDWFLLAFPRLARVRIDAGAGTDSTSRVIEDLDSRWLVAAEQRTYSPDALANLPENRRDCETFDVRVAVPRTSDAQLPETLLAPTPTDVPWTWPVMVVATAAVDESRRRVLPGFAGREVAEAVGQVTAGAIERVRANGAGDSGGSVSAGELLSFVPTRDSTGWFDAAARASFVAEFARREVLGAGEPVMLTDPDLSGNEHVCALASRYVPGLVCVPRSAQHAARVVGVRGVDLADVLAGVTWPDGAAQVLGPLMSNPDVRGAVGAMTVPTQPNGRLVQINAAYVPQVSERAEGLLVAAGAPVIESALGEVALGEIALAAGAKPLDAAEALRWPALADYVADASDADDAETLAELVAAVLDDEASRSLFATAHDAADPLPRAEYAWLEQVELPTATGDLAPGWSVVAPGSALAGWVDADAADVMEAELDARFDARVWERFGVRGELAVVPLAGVASEDVPDADWADELPPGQITSGAVIAGLDLVRADAVGAALRAINSDPALRAAFTEPLVVVGPSGSQAAASHAAWWVAGDLDCEGELGGVLAAWAPEPIPELEGLRADMLAALGVVADFGALDAAGWDAVFTACEDRPDVPAWQVEAFWRALSDWVGREWVSSDAAGGAADVEPPAVVPVVDARGGVLWSNPAEVTCINRAWWWLRDDVGECAWCPVEGVGDVARFVGARVVPEGARKGGVAEPVPDAVAWALVDAPTRWVRHERLMVGGQPVPWWVEHADAGAAGEPVVHVCGGPGEHDRLLAACAAAAGAFDALPVAVMRAAVRSRL